MILSKFTKLCNYHHNPVIEGFITPKVPRELLQFIFFPQPEVTETHFLPCRIAFSGCFI